MNYKFEYPVPKEYDLEKDYYKKDVIRKENLIDGATYEGVCRNADEAIWDEIENSFVYDRYKFGMTYDDFINHIEDDDGYDVFIPIYQKKEKCHSCKYKKTCKLLKESKYLGSEILGCIHYQKKN